MSMQFEDLKWDDLMTRASGKEDMIPELKGHLTPLLRDLRTVRTLYVNQRIPDVRLMSIDLENLTAGVDMLAQLRKASVDEERLTNGVSDLNLLIANMRERTSNLISAKVTEMSTHTSVSVGGMSVLVTKPVRSDIPHAPGATPTPQLVLSTPIGKPGIPATVSGEFLCAELVQETKFEHASPAVYLLPDGESMEIPKGQGLTVWSGLSKDALRQVSDKAVWEGFSAESAREILANSAYRLEAISEDTQLHGPCFVSESKGPQGLLFKNLGFEQFGRKPMHGVDSLDLMMVMLISSFLSVAMLLPLAYASHLLENNPNSLLGWGIRVSFFGLVTCGVLKLFMDLYRERFVTSGGVPSRIFRSLWNWNVRKRACKNGIVSQKNTSIIKKRWHELGPIRSTLHLLRGKNTVYGPPKRDYNYEDYYFLSRPLMFDQSGKMMLYAGGNKFVSQ